MKNRNKNTEKREPNSYLLWLVFGFMNCMNYAYAQMPPGFEEFINDNDPATPIGGLVALGLVIGGAIGVKKLLNKKE
jgi:hypothetical protein